MRSKPHHRACPLRPESGQTADGLSRSALCQSRHRRRNRQLQGHASLVGEIEGVHPAIGWVEVKIKLILDSPRSKRSLRRLKNGHGERLDGYVEEGCTKRVHVRPARSIFSNALNFCCS